MNKKEKQAWAKYNNGTVERPDYTDPKTGICFNLQFVNGNLECYCTLCAFNWEAEE
jgi:hypothetical protein